MMSVERGEICQTACNVNPRRCLLLCRDVVWQNLVKSVHCHKCNKQPVFPHPIIRTLLMSLCGRLGVLGVGMEWKKVHFSHLQGAVELQLCAHVSACVWLCVCVCPSPESIPSGEYSLHCLTHGHVSLQPAHCSDIWNEHQPTTDHGTWTC